MESSLWKQLRADGPSIPSRRSVSLTSFVPRPGGVNCLKQAHTAGRLFLRGRSCGDFSGKDLLSEAADHHGHKPSVQIAAGPGEKTSRSIPEPGIAACLCFVSLAMVLRRRKQTILCARVVARPLGSLRACGGLIDFADRWRNLRSKAVRRRRMGGRVVEGSSLEN